MRGTSMIAVVLALLFAAVPAAASSALDLVRIAKSYEDAHQDDIALRRYMDALALDPSCGEAYLGLGSLRARRGDLREAERVYSVAIEHVPSLRLAYIGRAGVRRSLGFTSEAIEDLLTGAEDELAALRTIAGWYGDDGKTPAQLAVWRRILSRAETLQFPPAVKEARTMVRALVILVGPADPAAAPADPRGLRQTLSVLARRAN